MSSSARLDEIEDRLAEIECELADLHAVTFALALRISPDLLERIEEMPDDEDDVG